MIEALAHSSLHNVGQRDNAKSAAVFRHKEWRASAIGNLRHALLNLKRHRMATLSDVFRYCFWSALANLAPVQVDAGHARLRGEGNEQRIQMTDFAAAQSVFFLGQYDNRTPFWSFIGKRGELRRVSQIGFDYVRARMEHCRLSIPQRDRPCLV